MNVVPAIFDAFGSVSALSKATGFPQQTVSEWRHRSPPEIPPWRRPAVAEAARKLPRPLSPEAVAYLASNERTPLAPSAEPARAA